MLTFFLFTFSKLVLSILSYFRCTPWIFSIILAYICLKDEGEIRMKKVGNFEEKKRSNIMHNRYTLH